jgi:hypothetical protein
MTVVDQSVKRQVWNARTEHRSQRREVDLETVE